MRAPTTERVSAQSTPSPKREKRPGQWPLGHRFFQAPHPSARSATGCAAVFAVFAARARLEFSRAVRALHLARRGSQKLFFLREGITKFTHCARRLPKTAEATPSSARASGSLPGRERVVRPVRVQDVPGRLAPLRAGLPRLARALGLLHLLRHGPPLHAAPQALDHLPPRIQAVALVDVGSVAHRAGSLTAACGLRRGRRAAPPGRQPPFPRRWPPGRPHRPPARRPPLPGCRAVFRLLRSASGPAS